MFHINNTKHLQFEFTLTLVTVMTMKSIITSCTNTCSLITSAISTVLWTYYNTKITISITFFSTSVSTIHVYFKYTSKQSMHKEMNIKEITYYISVVPSKPHLF